MGAENSRLDEEIGVPLIRAAELEADWKTLTASLSKAFFHGVAAVFGSPTQAASALSSLVDATQAIKVSSDPRLNAWHLFLLSLGWVFDTLKQIHELNDDELRPVFEAVIKDAKQQIEASDYYIRPNFFTRPSSNRLFARLRDEFVRRKHTLRGLTTESADSLKSRMNASFDRAVYEISVRRPDLYASVSTVLRIGLENPSSEHLAWRHYRSILIDEFESRPLFGQEGTGVPISQLYVPLRGVITNTSQRRSGSDTNDRPPLGTIWIDRELERWSSSPSGGQIRLVGGGPGSGKSTTLRSLSSRLAKREDVRVILVPLQHIGMDADLRTSVTNYFRLRAQTDLSIDPLAVEAVRSGPRLVLIFDGLDEIAKPGEAADGIAQLFVHKLNQLLNGLRIGDAALEPKIIVSGRMPAFQAVAHYLDIPSSASMEVHGFLPISSERDADDIDRLDQRREWWERYAAVFQKPLTPPSRFLGSDWRSLTHEPLLCYLLALSGYLEDTPADDVVNVNLVYESLINQIWLRGWGDSPNKKNRRGPGRLLNQADFNHLMETIALAAWRGGDTRIAGEAEFLNAVHLTHCEDAWENFEDENGQDVANLAMNFYLKTAGPGSRGFEFTHKSFGDYLAARALLRLAADITAYGDRRIDHAMQDWVRAMSSCVMSTEIASFIRREVELNVLESRQGRESSRVTKRFFERMAAISLEEGFSFDRTSLNSFRGISHAQRNADLTAWAVINSYYRALTTLGESAPVDLRNFAPSFDLRDLIERLSVSSSSGQNVGGSFLSGIVAPKSDLFGLNYSNLDFDGANIYDSNLSWSGMREWVFDNSDLRKCRFLRCVIRGTSFAGADVNEAHFGGTRLDDSNPMHKTKGIVFMNAATLALMDDVTLGGIKRSRAQTKRIRGTDAYGQDYDDETVGNLAAYSVMRPNVAFVSERELFENEDSDEEEGGSA